ncbi:MAG: hypothetical protein HOV80_05605, partial [Polyangiaceae bacterium]|nr:hypothetical protein [Polyangiaceae bacterium]
VVRSFVPFVVCLALASCDADETSATSGGAGGQAATITSSSASATTVVSSTAQGSTGQGSSATTSATTGAGGAPYMLAVGDLAPDFSLLDVNPASSTSGQPVSPRDYLQRVSGWYFGHAT